MQRSAVLRASEPDSARKERGAFFTPPALCRYVAEWALRSPDDRVLEPSCGEAAFLLAVGEQLNRLGAPGTPGPRLHGFQHRSPGWKRLHGVELHETSVVEAARLCTAARVEAMFHIGDFFGYTPPFQYDAVVGNPPYVRYQDFTGQSRLQAQEMALKHQVRLSGLASSWAGFVVHAASMLSPSGRLGLVLPAELLTVNYAAPIRSFLLRRFEKVRLVLFEERVFPGVLEEVVLLLAEGTGPTTHFDLHQVQDGAGLAQLDRASAPSRWTPTITSGKWIEALLPAPAAELYGRLVGNGEFESLTRWGKASLGMVTGNNRWFAISRERARLLGLVDSDVRRISPPGSRHLRGLTFAESAWEELAESGSAVYLFSPAGEPSTAGQTYIEAGEATGVNKAYKCRVRTPWWRVPTVGAADLLFTYMNHDTPRLTFNSAKVGYLNSVHGIKLVDERRALGTSLLPLAALNSVTLLGAEVVGRSYGGGMLKLEPREADMLPVPSAGTVQLVAPALRALRPQLAQDLRQGDLLAAVGKVDEVLLVGGLKLRRPEVKALRAAREAFFARRAARG